MATVIGRVGANKREHSRKQRREVRFALIRPYEPPYGFRNGPVGRRGYQCAVPGRVSQAARRAAVSAGARGAGASE